jgi:hypothetical protein
MNRSVDLNRDHRYKETGTTLLPLGGVRGGKLVSKEMIERGSEASATTIAIYVTSKEIKSNRKIQGTRGMWIS